VGHGIGGVVACKGGDADKARLVLPVELRSMIRSVIVDKKASHT
jgi:hypothetical protein